jgi:aromatic-L-amino-acid/L-tryptophan decarboxylase
MPESALPEPDEDTLAAVLGDALADVVSLWSQRRATGGSTAVRVAPSLDTGLPEEGSPLETLATRLRALLDGAGPCGADPLDFSHIPSTGNPAAFVADCFAAAVNVQSASARLAPLAVSLERIVLAWTSEFVGFGEAGAGILLSGSSLANLSALTAARDAALPAARQRGLSQLPPGRLYASRDVHSCITRAARMLGLGEDGLVDTSSHDPEHIDPDLLAHAIAADRAAGRIPVAVVATVGTTATGAIDPLDEIASVTSAAGVWLHVDGAYGAVAGAVDEKLARALAHVDSLALDLHKWLFMPYETGMLLVRDTATLAGSFAFSADYLELAGAPLPAEDPMQLGPELSRGLRALRIWATFNWAGSQQLREAIRHTLSLASRFHAALLSSLWLEPLAPPQLSVVCLRLRGSEGLEQARSDALHAACLEALAAEQTRFSLSTIRRQGRLVLRACFVNPRTRQSDVDALATLLERIARSVMPITQQ